MRLWLVIVILMLIKICLILLFVILEKRKNCIIWRFFLIIYVFLSVRVMNGLLYLSIFWMMILNWWIMIRLIMMVFYVWCNVLVILKMKEIFFFKLIIFIWLEIIVKLKVVCVLFYVLLIMIFWCKNFVMEILKIYWSLMIICVILKIFMWFILLEYMNLGDGVCK